MACKECGSFAINHSHHGRDGSDPDLCDVCFWRQRAAPLVRLTDEEIHKLIKEQHGKSVEGSNILPFTYADAIMNAMIAKNGGKV